MDNYASVDDIRALWRHLTSEEAERAEALLPVIGALFRQRMRARDKDLDTLIEEDEDYRLIVKSAVVDVISYNMALASSDAVTSPIAQVSESALGYSQTVSYATPRADDLYIPESVWKKIGAKRQRYGSMEVF